MTPSELGYVKCGWCKCVRPKEATRFIDGSYECLDVEWCELEYSRIYPRGPVFAKTVQSLATGLDENGDAL